MPEVPGCRVDWHPSATPARVLDRIVGSHGFAGSKPAIADHLPLGPFTAATTGGVESSGIENLRRIVEVRCCPVHRDVDDGNNAVGGTADSRKVGAIKVVRRGLVKDQVAVRWHR